MPAAPALTVADRIRERFDKLTRAERKLAASILADYPASGLGGIAAIADSADVSPPTVVRMGKKIGFGSFPEMQAALRGEVRATISDPIAKHDRWAVDAPAAHILNRFAAAVTANIRWTLRLMDHRRFNDAAALLADRKRAAHVVGGRLTRSLADYFFTHLQVIRGNVTLIAPNANIWPHYALNIKKDDIIVVFDVRRYERDTLRLAETARRQKALIILFTDQWGSPIAKHSAHSFHARIEVPSAWDSSVASLMIVESLLAAVETSLWKSTRHRIKTLENLYDQTGMFQKSP
ncbi:MAG: MurR/RpiR family transcriptional regulator [Gammaproteobacteria bacterium]